MFAWLNNAATTPLIAFLILIGGIAALLGGGHWLVTGAAALARRLGVSTLVIGFTVVAFGTSAPELAFNVIAAIDDRTELSFGNVVGSNIANVGLILGFTAIIAPLVVHSRVIKRELPWLIVATIACFVFALEPWLADSRGLGRIEGTVALVAFGVFLLGFWRLGRQADADPLVEDFGDAGSQGESETSLLLASAATVLGLAALLAGGKLTEVGAVNIAKAVGLSDALIGLTVVAVATSLPEGVTCVIAARRGHSDLAIGNIIGSNIFNLLLVLATTAVIRPVLLPASGWQDLAAMLALTLVLIPMARSKRSISRTEGILLLAAYLAYMSWSVMREL